MGPVFTRRPFFSRHCFGREKIKCDFKIFTGRDEHKSKTFLPNNCQRQAKLPWLTPVVTTLCLKTPGLLLFRGWALLISTDVVGITMGPSKFDRRAPDALLAQPQYNVHHVEFWEQRKPQSDSNTADMSNISEIPLIFLRSRISEMSDMSAVLLFVVVLFFLLVFPSVLRIFRCFFS
jgi:hypothetical protein